MIKNLIDSLVRKTRLKNSKKWYFKTLITVMTEFKKKWINKRYSPNRPSCIDSQYLLRFSTFLSNTFLFGMERDGGMGWVGITLNRSTVKFINEPTNEAWICAFIGLALKYRKVLQ